MYLSGLTAVVVACKPESFEEGIAFGSVGDSAEVEFVLEEGAARTPDMPSSLCFGAQQFDGEGSDNAFSRLNMLLFSDSGTGQFECCRVARGKGPECLFLVQSPGSDCQAPPALGNCDLLDFVVFGQLTTPAEAVETLSELKVAPTAIDSRLSAEWARQNLVVVGHWPTGEDQTVRQRLVEDWRLFSQARAGQPVLLHLHLKFLKALKY